MFRKNHQSNPPMRAVPRFLSARFVKYTVMLSACVASFMAVTYNTKAQSENRLEKKKIVFLTGDDFNHASGTHEFHAGALLLEKSLKSAGYEEVIQSEIVNNWPEDTAIFKDADVIVHYYKGNKAHFMDKNHAQLKELAKADSSHLFIHYAVDPGAEGEGALTEWTGGVYKDKFSTNPHWTLNSQLQKHPINQGVNDYMSHDEWYVNMQYEKEIQVGYDQAKGAGEVYSVMHGLNDDFQKGRGIKKPFKRELSPQELTVFWAKERADGGRGVGITGAHYHKNWANDDFRKQVLNAIVWAAKLPVPEAGVVSPSITEAEINENLDARKRGGLKKISLK